MQQARDGGLGQARQVVQFLQTQRVMFSQQFDNVQGALHRAHRAAFVFGLHTRLHITPAGFDGWN
ncbi:hypothetical protein D3C81_2317150 [compost metagenome]